MLPKIFLDLVSPWCGYLKCFTRVGKHVEQKIRIAPHLNQKLWTKMKKCRRSKDYQFFSVFGIFIVLESISWKIQYFSNCELFFSSQWATLGGNWFYEFFMPKVATPKYWKRAPFFWNAHFFMAGFCQKTCKNRIISWILGR